MKAGDVVKNTFKHAINVFAQWLPGEGFFIWAGEHGSPADNGYIPPGELRFLLFAWHRPSFYGTFIDLLEYKGRVGIKVSPRTALDLFIEPTHAMNRNWQWSDEIILLRQIAPLIKDALREGRWMPDFDKWQQGQYGWRVNWNDQFAAEKLKRLPYAREWVNEIIIELIGQSPAVGQAWKEITATYPLLQAGLFRAGFYGDEQDWLEAIGWLQDSTPFRTCLQLVEPGYGEERWQLKILLQDKDDPGRLFQWKQPVDGGDMPAGWHKHHNKIERDVQKWSEIVPGLKPRPEAAGPETGDLSWELGEAEAWEFLDSGSIQLVNAGYTVFLPKWWEEIQQLKPKLKVKTKSSVGSWSESWLGADQLVKFDWKLAVGDIELDEEEFRSAISKKQRLIQVKGRWIQLDPAFLARVQKLIRRKKGLSLGEILHLHFLADSIQVDEGQGEEEAGETVPIEVELNSQLSQMVEQLTHITTIPIEETPAAFHGRLRNYQQVGASWLLFLRRFGLGGCLADDMGLGKTIQWIAYLLKVKEKESPAAPSLLICPTSVLGNWQKELGRFAPGLSVYLHYGPQRKKGEDFLSVAAGVDLVITSYNLAHLDEGELGRVNWDCICLDEAQNIKNAYTKQSSAVRKFSGRHRVALTGTPMENRLTELWSIIDFLNPGYLGSSGQFNRSFVSVIERKREEKYIRRVQRLIRPFMLRRVKTDPDIELDLPEKLEQKEYIPLTVEQASVYESVLNDMFERLEETSGIARRGLILSVLTRLKQLCDHPSLLLKDIDTASLQEPGGKTRGKGQGKARSNRWPAGLMERSNKIIRLLEMVGELRQRGERCLIFTQFIGMGQILKYILENELGETVFFLSGSTPRSQRDEMISRFQDMSLPSREACHIFILSLKAGGLGLNLTAANHVFHFDRWWNPAVENQATDRSHRIGQSRHVQVHKFISLGTLEERIDEMLERKQGLNDQIVGSGEKWITEISTGELRELFALRREWVGD